MAPKAIVFSDFDGTITQKDSNDYLTDNYGFGYDRRSELNGKVLKGSMSFRDSFKLMLDSVAANKSFEECKQILVENISLDPSFKTFYDWCLQNDIPIIVLSSGMAPVIRVLLEELVGPSVENIEIIANDVRDKSDGTWEIVFHDESHFGHDKSIAIRKYREEREKLSKSEGLREGFTSFGGFPKREGLPNLGGLREGFTSFGGLPKSEKLPNFGGGGGFPKSEKLPNFGGGGGFPKSEKLPSFGGGGGFPKSEKLPSFGGGGGFPKSEKLPSFGGGGGFPKSDKLPNFGGLSKGEKLPKSEQPVFFYCGDGVSDLSAAKETEVLFAKIGHDLITYCQRENIPFKVFSDFQDIHREVQAVVEGKKTIQQLVEEGAKEAAEQNLADSSRK